MLFFKVSHAGHSDFRVSDGVCLHYTSPCAFHTRKHVFCVWLKFKHAFFRFLSENNYLHRHRSCLTGSHPCLITFLFHFLTAAPSLLLPSHDLGGHFGQIAEQSLLTPVTQHTEYNFGATTEESRVSTVQEEQHAHPSSSSSSQSDRW